MSYISVSFIELVVFGMLAYYALPLGARPYALLALSAFFYAQAGWDHALCLLALIAATYAAARAMQGEPQRKKPILLAYLVLVVGALSYVKFINYALGLVGRIMGGETLSVAVIVPLGLSFTALQAIGYVADVYRGKYAAQKNPLRVALFLSYFPIVVQGPISRADQLMEQLFVPHRFDYTRIKHGLQLALWGLFKKLVVANRAAVFADMVFGEYRLYSGLAVIAGTLFYSAQIYADFSGCVDICRGVSQLFGVQIMDNFDHPYFAASVKDFWRRWHISLSSWLRDYVYIPLGGNRRGKLRRRMNLVLTFLVSGLWHGVGIRYLAWGLYHGVCQIIGEITRKPKDALYARMHIRTDTRLFRLGQQTVTFALIAYSWLIFRANGLMAALRMTRSIFVDFFCFDQLSALFADGKELGALLAGVGVMFIVSLLQTRMRVRETLDKKPLVLRWTLDLLLLFAVIVFGVYGDAYDASNFLYMQF